MYNNQKISDALGMDMSITMDVALAKEGTYSIVEVFYSTMKGTADAPRTRLLKFLH